MVFVYSTFVCVYYTFLVVSRIDFTVEYILKNLLNEQKTHRFLQAHLYLHKNKI